MQDYPGAWSSTLVLAVPRHKCVYICTLNTSVNYGTPHSPRHIQSLEWVLQNLFTTLVYGHVGTVEHHTFITLKFLTMHNIIQHFVQNYFHNFSSHANLNIHKSEYTQDHCKKRVVLTLIWLLQFHTLLDNSMQKNYPAMTFLRLWNVYVVY